MTFHSSRRLRIDSAGQFVHCLLFLQEFVGSHRQKRNPDLTPVAFFLERTGGLHLLLLLLNVAYQKPAFGWARGWPFGVLAARVDISERSLRQLLSDAIEEGVVVRRPGHIDKRRAVYCATPRMIRAWSALFDKLSVSLQDVFASLGSNFLVEIDYRDWDPAVPAQDQAPSRAVLRHLKSAVRSVPEPDAPPAGG
jgi:DNA-binding HxlR family transcriptional regulator